MLEKLGYVTFPSRGSRGIDIFAVHEGNGAPHIAAEIGGVSKVITAAFEDLFNRRVPAGTVRIVAKEVKKGARWDWTFYLAPGQRFKTLPDLFDAARQA